MRFGMLMPNRSFNADGQKHLFHGMEHDGEVSGSGNSYTTEFRQYDPRLGRWKSVDPLAHEFPWSSPYVAFNNNPIVFIDPDGRAAVNANGGDDPDEKGLSKEQKKEIKNQIKEDIKEIGGFVDRVIQRRNERRRFRAEDYAARKEGKVFEKEGRRGRKFYSVQYASESSDGEFALAAKIFNKGKRKRQALRGNRGSGPDLVGGRLIGSYINTSSGTVRVSYGKTNDGVNSNRLINPAAVRALGIVVEEASQESNIFSIHISSTTNGAHSATSNHYVENGATAIDISRVNGIKMLVSGANAQVMALQNAIENLPNVNENFGPYMKKKRGVNVQVAGHKDHIHFSVSP